MAFHYPNGRLYQPTNKKQVEDKQTKKINHRSLKNNSSVIYGNRGMTLEQAINESNNYYLAVKRAVIHKKPIPIQIVDVSYPKRSAAVIKEAYFKKASTTDYNGIYKGKYIDFEAKETKNKTSFPLSNFHSHQIEHMKACRDLGGICFTIVRFSSTDELFILPFDLLLKYWNEKDFARKSIPKKEIETVGVKLKNSISPPIQYLDGIDLLYNL